MSSTGISSLPAEVPQSVSKAVEAFGQGELSLLEVRQAVATALEENPVIAEPIHQLLDEALKTRTLSIADYGELVGAVGSVVSENVPTECSEDAPDESGVFRVVDQGTLVPTDLSEWPEFKAHVADESAEQDEHTRPYDLDGVSDDAKDSAGPGERDAEEPDAGRTTIVSHGPGTVLRDRFRLEEEVARGAMGVVYRATDLMKLDAGAVDPHVAIKLVSPEIAGDANALRSFQNEFVSTQHLSHPSIIRVFELDRDDDQYFITMEWLEGQSLASLLDSSQGSALQPTQTYAIIEQLCDALIYAHEHSVVHADVKPGNVFLLKSGEVKLIDFGIARCENDLGDQTGDQSGEAVALTPAYASCERLEKQTPAPQDDLYSLASLIYRLLAGRRVFGPLTALEAEAQDAEAVRIGGMDDSRWNALAKALAFRRDGRQATVNDFAEEFGRRSRPREATVEDVAGEEATDETAQLPILEAVPDADPSVDLELPADMEVDFPLDADAANAPEPELSGIFDAAALSGDSEEIVLSSEPEPVPQPIDYPPQTATAEQKAKPLKLPAVKLPAVSLAPLLNRLSNISRTEQQTAGAVLIAVAVLAVLVGWLGGAEEAAPTRTVSMPELAAPASERAEVEPEAVQPQPEPVVRAAEPEVASEPEPVVAVAEPAVVAEPEPLAVVTEPEVVPEPEVVAEPAEVEVAAEPEAVAETVEPEIAAEPEVVAEVAEVETVNEAVIVAETNETEAVPETATAEVVETEVTEITEAEVVPELQAVVDAVETEADIERSAEAGPLLAAATTDTAPAEGEFIGPEPVYAPPPAPESVALSELDFVKYAEPRYPRSSIDRRYEGWVDVEFRVGADGLPVDIEVVDSNLPAKFAATSVAAVKKWRFQPYLHEGEAIAVSSAVRLRYAN